MLWRCYPDQNLTAPNILLPPSRVNFKIAVSKVVPLPLILKWSPLTTVVIFRVLVPDIIARIDNLGDGGAAAFVAHGKVQAVALGRVALIHGNAELGVAKNAVESGVDLLEAVVTRAAAPIHAGPRVVPLTGFKAAGCSLVGHLGAPVVNSGRGSGGRGQGNRRHGGEGKRELLKRRFSSISLLWGWGENTIVDD